MFAEMAGWQIIAAILIDLAIGDPRGWPHPIILIGNLVDRATKLLEGAITDKRIGGAILVAVVLTATLTAVSLLLSFAGALGSIIQGLVAIFLAYTVLALRSLHQESKLVIDALEAGDILAARSALSMIVGRDTAELSEEDIVRATIETVAENSSDGVIAPLFYLFLGGPILAFAYKAINTMDSMVGYKNERFIDFGRYAAKIDDVANYIPARLTAALMVAVAAILKLDWQGAISTVTADARKHSSPNAGFPEAAVSGALGIVLGGPSYYFGKLLEKPTIGNGQRSATIADYHRTIQLMYGATGLMVVVALLLRGLS